jgi:hypothetical protein
VNTLGDENLEYARAELVRIAKRMIDGEIRPLLGARLLCPYANRLRQEIGHEAWQIIVGVDSESDHLPIGTERQLWATEALREKDKITDDYEQRVRNELLQVAQELLAQFSKD